MTLIPALMGAVALTALAEARRTDTSSPGRLQATQQCEAERLPESGHDPEPIVWYFFIEQIYGKWWS
jgi:hypothetical protein